MESERGTREGVTNTTPQSRGSVTGATEERRAEAGKLYRKVDRAGGHGAVKDGAGGQSDPRASGECAAEAERVGENEADKRGAGAAEGRGEDLGKRLTGAAGAVAHVAGGGEGSAKPGSGSQNSILG